MCHVNVKLSSYYVYLLNRMYICKQKENKIQLLFQLGKSSIEKPFSMLFTHHVYGLQQAIHHLASKKPLHIFNTYIYIITISLALVKKSTTLKPTTYNAKISTTKRLHNRNHAKELAEPTKKNPSKHIRCSFDA